MMHAGVKAISSGGWHSMILKQDGSVWTEGDNTYGQLGFNIRYPRNTYTKAVSSGQCGTMV